MTNNQNKLTVLIPCKNEVKNIRLCIESIRDIADEVLIADSGSTDGTLDVVRQIGGCRIIEREYIHSGNFKNWAIPQASHPWILIVDADERVTPELAAEIKSELQNPQHDGYRILRRNHIFGREIKHCGWNNDSVLRLFRRDMGRYCDRGVHADVIISSGNIGKLNAKFLHFTYWNFEQYLEKFDRYTTLAARDLEKRGRRNCLEPAHAGAVSISEPVPHSRRISGWHARLDSLHAHRVLLIHQARQTLGDAQRPATA